MILIIVSIINYRFPEFNEEGETAHGNLKILTNIMSYIYDQDIVDIHPVNCTPGTAS